MHPYDPRLGSSRFMVSHLYLIDQYLTGVYCCPDSILLNIMQDYHNSKTNSFLKEIQTKLSSNHHSAPHPTHSDPIDISLNSNLALSKYLDSEPTSNIEHIRNRLKLMSSRQKTVATDKLISGKREESLQRRIEELEQEKKHLQEKMVQMENSSLERSSAELEIKVRLQAEEILFLNRCNRIQQEEIQKLRRAVCNLENREFASVERRSDPRPSYSTPSKKTVARLQDLSAQEVRLATEESISSTTNATKKKYEQYGKSKYSSMYLRKTHGI